MDKELMEPLADIVVFILCIILAKLICRLIFKDGDI